MSEWRPEAGEKATLLSPSSTGLGPGGAGGGQGWGGRGGGVSFGFRVRGGGREGENQEGENEERHDQVLIMGEETATQTQGEGRVQFALCGC